MGGDSSHMVYCVRLSSADSANAHDFMVRVILPQNGTRYASRIWGSLWKRTHKKIYGSC